MYSSIDLSGVWNFQMDEDKNNIKFPLSDVITLPGTTSYFKKGKKNENIEIGCLTDEYKFEGYACFSKEISIEKEFANKTFSVYLERTRVTTLWIDEKEIGTQNSLCTPHIYKIEDGLSEGKHTITIIVDNVNYLTRGGHLTSPDTQTNWNGITGRIELQFFNDKYFEDVQVYCNAKENSIQIKGKLLGEAKGEILVSAQAIDNNHKVLEKAFCASSEFSITYPMENSLKWSEYEPNLYKLQLKLVDGEVKDTNEIIFGMRDFKAEGDKFTINGHKTFLRGKHDGMIFPLTGFAPTDVDSWLKILKISKSYGINHYRFHTCCPPEAAFIAADMLGVYMEPELPFWGTITDESYENHNAEEQQFLVNEGFAILKAFGNHPSFVMMSLGNELWGSRERLNEILGAYKKYDNRHLYTEGSNNFQFCPVILENEDFFSGVRFSKDRLIRGSYAMCDAPLGHVQTAYPSTLKDYDENIIPKHNLKNSSSQAENKIEIQFGTGTKTVEANEYDENMIPEVPVVSHEIGQYATYPNFKEISKYTGSIKAKNFEVFKHRLEEKGLEDLAEKYFYASGKLAAACYKEELEAAFRSRKMAGFQLLDLQDFSGQGTALVGVLDAFMEPKGTISEEEWRSFCSDAVLMARFEKYNYRAGENFHAHIELCYYRNIPLKNFKLSWQLKDGEAVYGSGEIDGLNTKDNNYIDISDIGIKMPVVTSVKKIELFIKIQGTEIEKSYDLWVYPNNIILDKTDLNIFSELSDDVISKLEKGENVLLLPALDKLNNSIEGFYCTDFWCYPMFRTISESMNKEVPVGTMGLLINNSHPIFKNFLSEEYSTYQWWNIVSNSRSTILDTTKKEFRPIVQTIDNFERNHKLGMIFECKVLKGNLLVCNCEFEKIVHEPESKQLLFSILEYLKSEDFKPEYEMSVEEIRNILV
ncbi:beta-glucuronidase [Clostridium sp. 19966]|uniref:glycoside hydrolase family 2 TIM barrel-domain containing protein n=1 Tax=Clostridium sp. 19966 TaxID=2768166 RepID=UPI0028DE0CF6|nr:glycoside hydrolase family 2 TIM barrel-domain containing protein [Clostridium sp. 19966]MDT8715166.1 beta-glucuronidase [Clostridium sp. 19966]